MLRASQEPSGAEMEVSGVKDNVRTLGERMAKIERDLNIVGDKPDVRALLEKVKENSMECYIFVTFGNGKNLEVKHISCNMQIMLFIASLTQLYKDNFRSISFEEYIDAFADSAKESYKRMSEKETTNEQD